MKIRVVMPLEPSPDWCFIVSNNRQYQRDEQVLDWTMMTPLLMILRVCHDASDDITRDFRQHAFNNYQMGGWIFVKFRKEVMPLNTGLN
jgi:hypothetical protein